MCKYVYSVDMNALYAMCGCVMSAKNKKLHCCIFFIVGEIFLLKSNLMNTVL